MKPVSGAERERLEQLSSRLGDRTLRQLLTPEGKRLVRPERIRNLSGGSGRLSEWEREQLRNISRNSNALVSLKKKGSGKREFKTNRALRDWLNTGKEKGVKFHDQEKDIREKQLTAIKALRFFGVEPNDGTYYVRKGQK